MLAICLVTRDGVLDRAAMISCDSDAVTDPVSRVGSSHPCHTVWRNVALPLSFEQQSFYFFYFVYLPSLFCFVIISTLGNAVYPRLLCACFCVCWEQGAQIFVCVCLFSRHNNSGSCGVISLIFLDGRWPDDACYSCLMVQPGIAHPWLLYCIQWHQMG
jgi:hypothetical protein